jgi:hypothetical protein
MEAAVDISNLTKTQFILYPLGTIPLWLFNLVTNSASAPHECTFLCFPSLPQIIFSLIFDIVLIYFISCSIIVIRKNFPFKQIKNSDF